MYLEAITCRRGRNVLGPSGLIIPCHISDSEGCLGTCTHNPPPPWVSERLCPTRRPSVAFSLWVCFRRWQTDRPRFPHTLGKRGLSLSLSLSTMLPCHLLHSGTLFRRTLMPSQLSDQHQLVIQNTWTTQSGKTKIWAFSSYSFLFLLFLASSSASFSDWPYCPEKGKIHLSSFFPVASFLCLFNIYHFRIISYFTLCHQIIYIYIYIQREEEKMITIIYLYLFLLSVSFKSYNLKNNNFKT